MFAFLSDGWFAYAVRTFPVASVPARRLFVAGFRNDDDDQGSVSHIQVWSRGRLRRWYRCDDDELRSAHVVFERPMWAEWEFLFGADDRFALALGQTTVTAPGAQSSQLASFLVNGAGSANDIPFDGVIQVMARIAPDRTLPIAITETVAGLEAAIRVEPHPAVVLSAELEDALLYVSGLMSLAEFSTDAVVEGDIWSFVGLAGALDTNERFSRSVADALRLDVVSSLLRSVFSPETDGWRQRLLNASIAF